MGFRYERYTDTVQQFTEMCELCVESYAIAGWPSNWLIGRIEDWKFGGHSLRVKENPDFFCDKAHLWRNDDGKLVGFCVSENGDDRIHIQMHPAHPKIEAVMLTWIADVWSLGKEKVETYAYASDERRQELLKKLGFEFAADVGITRKYDLVYLIDYKPLAPGFRIERLSQNRNYDGMVDAVNAAFARPKKLNRDWLDSKVFGAPSMNEEWVFSALASDGEHASFCFVWIDDINKIAEIDPIGTRPEFQGQGLAKAVVTACFRALQETGIRAAYITSGAEPHPSNKLYESLGPIAKWEEQRWAKQSRS
jgi:ribosomal protein S18 acetylase RimI-like enzyme